MANEVSKLVKQMQLMLSEARSHEDLQRLLQVAIDYGKPIKYDNKSLHIASALLLCAVVVTRYLYTYQTILLIIAIICALFPSFIASGRSSKLRKLERDIFLQDACLDNGLSAASAPFFNELDSCYSEFIRGNHSRDIRDYMEGSIQKEEYELHYAVYRFHWVVKHTNSKGKTRYKHYNRYGLFVKDFTSSNIQIMGDASVHSRYNTEWKTPSIAFNKIFEVYTEDEIKAAKFLKPVVILAFEEFSKHFSNINAEVDGNHRLCLSFADELLNLDMTTHSLEDPKAFAEALNGRTDFAKLNQALDFVYNLMIKTDNNFLQKLPHGKVAVPSEAELTDGAKRSL